MAPKPVKQTQKLVKLDATLDQASDIANHLANNTSEEASALAKSYLPFKQMKEDFISRFDGLLNAIDGLQTEWTPHGLSGMLSLPMAVQVDQRSSIIGLRSEPLWMYVLWDG